MGFVSDEDVNDLLETIDNLNRELYSNKELVVHPSHYNKEGRRECWDEMIDISPLGTLFFDLWSAYKYKYRAGEKDGNPEEQDLAKIQNYINHAEKLYGQVPMTSAENQIYNKMMEALKCQN